MSELHDLFDRIRAGKCAAGGCGSGGGQISVITWTGNGTDSRALVSSLTIPPVGAFWRRGTELGYYKLNGFDTNAFRVLDNDDPLIGVRFNGNEMLVSNVPGANEDGIDYTGWIFG